MAYNKNSFFFLALTFIFLGTIFIYGNNTASAEVSTSTSSTTSIFPQSFTPELWKYKRTIIPENKNTELIGFTLPYNSLINVFNRDIRIKRNSDLLPYEILKPKTPKIFRTLNIIDRYEVNDRNVAVIDLASSTNDNLLISITADAGEYTASLFGANEYYGIDNTSWFNIVKNINIYKNVATKEQTLLSLMSLVYPKTDYKYLMLVLKPSCDQCLASHIIQLETLDPFIKSGEENIYVKGEFQIDNYEQNSNSSIILDIGTNMFLNNLIRLNLQKDSIVMPVTIESSLDKNKWTYRGDDNLYSFGDRKKNWIKYDANSDRFIKIKFKQTDVPVHELISIHGIGPTIVFYNKKYVTADSTMTSTSTDQISTSTGSIGDKYDIYYGNEFAVKPKFDLDDSTFIKSADKSLISKATLGIIESNPKYLYLSNDETESVMDKYPYLETVIIGMLSISILYFISIILE